MDAGPLTFTITPATREAGPLPVKRGEIGFDPVTANNVDSSSATNEQIIELPERHPADRDSPRTASVHSPPVPNTPITPLADKDVVAKDTVYGFRTTQAIILGVLLTTVVGTIVAWAVISGVMNRKALPGLTGYGAIVLHVIFAIGLLIQLIIFERRLYIARADRFARLHPDALVDPTSNVCPSTLAPWARPPLPTYAATLAHSGVGTGDVEDHLIAAPPPPAYGNTRGSTLLLSGFLTEQMRRERPVSTTTRQSNRLGVPRDERPLSYRSHDEQWEEYCDAQRARILEDTLATLERPPSAVTRTRTR